METRSTVRKVGFVTDSVVYRSVFAVDPGTTTGWCWALVPAGSMSAWDKVQLAHNAGFLKHGQLNYSGNEDSIVEALFSLWLRSVDKARSCVPKSGSVSLVTSFLTEDFVVRMFNSNRSFLSPVRINAKLDWLMHDGLLVPDIHQKYSPSAAKGTVTDSRMSSLLKVGRWRPHEKDALRHLVLHLMDVNQ